MACVVFLRGVNVGGHKTFRPSVVASQLRHLDVVNIGAAGTFVVRERAPRAKVLAEFARRLPFETKIMICDARDILRLLSENPFTGEPAGPRIVRFVSVLSKRPRSEPSLPLSMPPKGAWLLQILARDGRFVFGHYRRHMKVIGFLGKVDSLFDAPITTRNWNTITAIAKTLKGGV